MDPEKKKILEDYLDDIIPAAPQEKHPFMRFEYAEIVIHPERGNGIVTGFRMPDLARELTGLGVQFVQNGQLKDHVVFTINEVSELKNTGIVYNPAVMGNLTLEQAVQLSAEKDDGQE